MTGDERADARLRQVTGCICGPAMVEHSRRHERDAWCFTCRSIRPFVRIVSVPVDPSPYEPNVDIRCGQCGQIDGDLFPGRCREWN